MNEHNMDDLFEVVKQAPTELSEQHVLEMITVIPTLPPPGSSWFNINLNSIIMTTTIVAVVSSALIYFNTLNAVSELPGQEPEQTTKTIVLADSAADTITTKPEIQEVSSQVQVITPAKIEIPIAQTEVLETAPQSELVKNAEPMVERDEETAVSKVLDVSHLAQTPSIKTSSEDKPEAMSMEQKKNIASSPVTKPAGNTSNREKSGTRTTNSSTASNPVPSVKARKPDTGKKSISDVQLRKLKRTLTRELYDDRIIPSKKPFMVVLEFKAKAVTVNFKPLDKELSNKYHKLLTQYAIKPGPDKRVVVDNDFIMVGRFTPSGFAGSAVGKHMKINFQDTTLFFREQGDILSPLKGSLTYSPSTPGFFNSIFSNGEKQGEPDIYEGSVRMETEGSVKAAEANTKTASLLTDDPDEDALRNQRMYRITNPVTLYDNKSDKEPIRIRDIEKFKKALYRVLLEDNEIANIKADVNMEINANLFKVNDNAVFSSEMKQRYIEFFKTYGFGPRETLRVLMSKDFIFIGEFGMKNFSGTVEGTLTRDSIRGSIFEELLTRYPMFGNNE